MYRFTKRNLLYAVAVMASISAAVWLLDCNAYVMRPLPELDVSRAPADNTRFAYDVPLDPTSPWPKFHANARQTGRSDVGPQVSDRTPWIFSTGKGIFSSPVIDADGTVYMGSADHCFYAIRVDGSLKWKACTGEIIDSSALLDDRGRVYVPSGDTYLYAFDRDSGGVVWRFKAHTPKQVEALHGIRVYNVDWWEGSVAMLADGTLIAGNDNYLYYLLDRDTGADKGHLVSNELGWSLPAVNTQTHQVFFGSMFVALRNVFAFDARSGEQLWSSGGLGSVVTSPLLTSNSADGAVVVAGFDGYVRAFGQKNGRQIWKFATRDHIYSSPAQLADGSIVTASTDGTVYALAPERGTLTWAFDTLEPIRSSPAIDGLDRIYVGAGDGKLLALNPDGTLRWAYRCIEEERNDLNGSPGLGKEGVYIGGEDGSICFVPYDYCLSGAGKADRRCVSGGNEAMPRDGASLYFTSRFGGLLTEPPRSIDANEPLAFTLAVRKQGDTVLALIDKDSLKAELSGGKATVSVSADRRFVTVVPESTWTGPQGGTLRVSLSGDFRTAPWRLGLKPFWGDKTGGFAQSFEFDVAARASTTMPYAVPQKPGEPATAFEIGRLAAPNPTMLPSWNQIGFDSLRYLGGIVEGSGRHAVLWLVGGRHDTASGRTVVNPADKTRFAMQFEWDDGLVTLHNEDGFTLDFNGSWGMPYQRYRVATRAAADGRIVRRPAINAVVDCDRIANYGLFLKLMGLSESDTGLMHIYGGAEMSVWGERPQTMPQGVGSVDFEVGTSQAVARITGGSIKETERAVGLLLVDAQSGTPVSLSYAFVTSVEVDANGVVTAVRVKYDPGTIKGPVRAYYMVDTYPASVARVAPAGEQSLGLSEKEAGIEERRQETGD